MFHFAYLDPGTGSIVIQAVIGVVAGAAFVLKNSIRKVVPKLRRTAEQEVEAD
jgi:hypothetical protein